MIEKEINLENQFLQILLDDHILNTGHGDLQQIRIRSVRKVGVNFSTRGSIQGNELVHKVFAGLLRIRGITLKICESEFGDGAVGNLLLE